MKKLLLSLLGVLMALPVLSRDFTYTHEGQTLTYTIIGNGYTCRTKDGYFPDMSTLVPGNDISGDVEIPDVAMKGKTKYTVVGIGYMSFHQKSGSEKEGITSIVLPATLKTIGENAFTGNKNLDKVEIPASVTSIGISAFMGCNSLSSVKLPEGITSLNSSIFAYCPSLASIAVPNSVESIDYGCFAECKALKTVVLGSGLKSMDVEVFLGCTNLTDIHSLATVPPTIYEATFPGYTATLHVPNGCTDAYKAAEYWKNFNNIMADASGIEDVVVDGANGAPVEVYNLSGVKVGSSVDGLLPGVYVVRQGKTVSKIFVR